MVEGDIGRHDVDMNCLYNDLRDIINHARFLKDKKEYSFDPLASGMSLGLSLNILIKIFNDEFVPSGWSFNIDKGDRDDRHHLTVYKSIAFYGCWHMFPIKPIAEKLKGVKPLQKAFYGVVGLLINFCGFSTWREGTLYMTDMLFYSEYSEIEEYASNNTESEEEYHQMIVALEEERHCYSQGDAYKMEQILKRNCSIKYIRRTATNYAFHPVSAWILKALEMVESPYHINHFSYNEHGEDDYYESGVPFSAQVTIMYKDDDLFTSITGEYLDGDAANFGVQDPTMFYVFHHEMKQIPTYDDGQSWITKISELHDEYNKLLNKT